MAEKYDIKTLKTLAETRYVMTIREGARNSLALLKAARIIYHEILLPDSDMARLKSVLVAYWMLSRHKDARLTDLEAGDARGEELRQLYKANGHFMFDCQTALWRGLTSSQDLEAMVLGSAKPRSK